MKRIFLFARQTALHCALYFSLQNLHTCSTMQQTCLTLLSGLCLCLVSLCNAEEGLEFPNFDGKDRVLDISERNYKKALRRYDLLCLFYHEPLPASKGLQKRFQMTELVLEVRKRVFRGRKKEEGLNQFQKYKTWQARL